ncbi:MAG: MBL fold metallo-hydrolase [Chloroflexota bacterium]
MRIRWLGHACFRIECACGLSFAIDPYADSIGYPALHILADYVAKSHGHDDHANISAVQGAKQVFDAAGEYHVGGVTVRATLTPHDDVGGAKRGPNLVFTFDDGDIRFCHLGDLGSTLTPEQLTSIGRVDVVCVPVGGVYTVDAAGAAAVCNQLKPRVVIPMHYRVGKLVYKLAEVNPFVQAMGGAEQLATNELELTRQSLPASRQVMVLNYVG